MNVQKPLIKYGWLRAIIYALAIFAVAFFVRQYFILVACVFLITFLCRRFLDGQSFTSLGFDWKHYTNEAMLGLFTAIAILGVGTIILVALGYLKFIGVTFTTDIFRELFFLFVVAFIEEIVFRGYLLNNLMQSTNKWIALLITAALFAAVHMGNPGANILPVINVFAAGMLLGVNYIYTKNLWFSILFHFAWNTFQGPVLGYDVSGLKMTTLIEQSMEGPTFITGGVFGFEGSIICLALIVLTGLLLAYAFLKRYTVSFKL
jgi:hypothetical protein